MAYHESIAERVRIEFELQGADFEEKKMMGGLCFMVDGKIVFFIPKSIQWSILYKKRPNLENPNRAKSQYPDSLIYQLGEFFFLIV